MTDLRRQAMELAGTIVAAGALGAELRLRRDGAAGDTLLRPALERVVAALGTSLDDADPAALAPTLSLLSFALQDALELLRDPGRAPGWTFTDPVLLQERGRSSAAMGRIIAQLTGRRDDVARALDGERVFLDVGTGAAWIAITLAQMLPQLRVVGIDLWEPALALARENVVREGVADRVTLRSQNVLALDEREAFDGVWVPLMFLPRTVAESAVPRLVAALRRGGILVAGTFASTGDALGDAVRDLTTIRSGGYPWSEDGLRAVLAGAGLVDIAPFAGGVQTNLVVGRRP